MQNFTIVLGSKPLMVKFCVYHGLSGIIPTLYCFHYSDGFVSIEGFYPTALRGVQVMFLPNASKWGVAGVVCPGCISENIRYKRLILGRDIG